MLGRTPLLYLHSRRYIYTFTAHPMGGSFRPACGTPTSVCCICVRASEEFERSGGKKVCFIFEEYQDKDNDMVITQLTRRSVEHWTRALTALG